MKNCKVDILGTEYTILFRHASKDNFLKDSDGYVDKSTKKIVIGKKEPDCELDNFKVYQRKVVRHEIVHAYLEESGLSANFEMKPLGIPETIVDWVAIQAPKMFKTFKELNVL